MGTSGCQHSREGWAGTGVLQRDSVHSLPLTGAEAYGDTTPEAGGTRGTCSTKATDRSGVDMAEVPTDKGTGMWSRLWRKKTRSAERRDSYL